MSSSTFRQVRAGLVATLKGIKTANGYNNNLPDDHFYSWGVHALHAQTHDDDYPKCFVRLLGGEIEPGVQESDFETLTFLFLVVFKDLNNGDDLDSLSENAIADTKRVLRLNHTLGGVAQNAYLSGYSLSEGVHEAESSVVQVIDVTVHNRN